MTDVIHRHRAGVALLACLTTAASLTACGPGSPEAGQPNTAPPWKSISASTSASASPPGSASPPASAGPTTAPQRPNTAVGLSLSAGESFVRYYVNLMNYASTTGDIAPLMSVTATNCKQCKGFADYVAKVNAANGGLSGDYFERVDDVPDLFRGDGGRLGGYAAVTIGAYTSKDSPSAKPATSTVQKYKREFTLVAQKGSWAMAATALVSQ
ncbi:DUF6318 family protein [Kribbella sp. HUAS MG21]|uniref:DUF6318 family protein n=1 Tax=Kribbella sp. HUAS MG21 TaxID=3160966 RepID=A0AAU7THL7_9ACTN